MNTFSRPVPFRSVARRAIEPVLSTSGPGRRLPIVVAELFRAVGRTLEHERESAVEYIERAIAILSLHSLRAISEPSTQIWSRGGAPVSPAQQSPQSRGVTLRLDTDDEQDSFDAIYVNAISIATVTRLICTDVRSFPRGTERASTGLQKWRLKRVMDHVDTHFAQTITLTSMAKAAGLTRMHFARQFKAATGIRPHEYLLRRRIERAKELLRDPSFPLADAALVVGFQTQPHFTTVFKRFVGQTPHRWRTSIGECAVVSPLAPSLLENPT